MPDDPTKPPTPPRAAAPVRGPVKLTPEFQTAMCRAIEKGAKVYDAALLLGVQKQLLYNWMDRGERGMKPYAAFVYAIRCARATRQLSLVEGTQRHITKHPQVGQWFLEREFPDNYSIDVAKMRVAEREWLLDVASRVLDATAYRALVVAIEAGERPAPP